MSSMSLYIVIQHLITLMHLSLYIVIQFVMQYDKNNTRLLNKYLAMKKKEDKIHSTHVSIHNNINIHRGWPVLNCRLVEL